MYTSAIIKMKLLQQIVCLTSNKIHVCGQEICPTLKSP